MKPLTIVGLAYFGLLWVLLMWKANAFLELHPLWLQVSIALVAAGLWAVWIVLERRARSS